MTLERATSDGISRGDLDLLVTAVPFKATNGTKAAVIVSAGVGYGAEPRQSGRLEFSVHAVDSRWRTAGLRRSTLTPPADGSALDVVSVLDLPAGRHALRVAVREPATGRVGSARLDVDVPDFRRTSLTLSGLVLQRSPGNVAGDVQPAEAIVRLHPTAARVFRSTDRVAGWVRVYVPRNPANAPASIETEILDDTGRPLFEQTRLAEPDREGQIDHSIRVPVDILRPGTYLLRVTVQGAGDTAARATQFWIE